MPLVFGAQGVAPTLRGQASNVFAMQAGQTYIVPAGTWYIGKKYARVQELDPITGIWRNIGDDGPWGYVRSDGSNIRLANQTGCAIGALITNAGSAYTSAPTVVTTTGGSIWQAIVGGAVNTTVTVTAGGSNYTYPPLVFFSAPGNPGIQATGYCTLSAGAVSTVTIQDQGAGYTNAPTVTFINDPREGLNGLGTGSGAAATTVLTGSQTVTGLLCLDHGTALTALPTFTITGGGGSSFAATVLMDWCITGYTVTGGGTVYTAGAGGVEVTANNRLVTGGTGTNPTSQAALLRQRRASIYAPTSAGGVITATNLQVNDGGHYLYAPGQNDTLIVVGQAIVTAAANLALTVGGLTDVVSMFPI
jgi:hypothetical protein